jgi:hypothetical protein
VTSSPILVQEVAVLVTLPLVRQFGLPASGPGQELEPRELLRPFSPLLSPEIFLLTCLAAPL